MKRKDIDARNSVIFKLFRQGLTLNDLAQKFNLGRNTIYSILKQFPEFKHRAIYKRKERDELIIKLLKKQISQKEIGKHLNISRELVRRVGLKHGIRSSWKATNKSEVVDLLKLGHSAQSVADKYNVTIDNVWNIARNSGLSEISPRNIGAKRRAERNDKILDALNKGASLEQVAKQFNLNKDYVAILVRQQGVRKRARRLDSNQKHKLIKFYVRKGKSADEIAGIIGMHPVNIRLIMNQLNSPSERIAFTYSQQRDKHIAEMLRSGRSTKEILELININANVIKHIRKKLNLAAVSKNYNKRFSGRRRVSGM